MTTKTLPNSTTTTYYYNGSGVTLVNAGVQGAPGASGLNFGFVVTGNNDTLINNGTVFGQRVGVYVTGSGDSVINAAGKNITATEAGQAGVNFYNFSGTVTNFGTISGFAGASQAYAGNAVEMRHGGLVTNFGTLLNGGALFRLNPGTLVNTGVILGNVAYGGVYMEAGGTVTNLAGGLISSNGATSSYEGAPPYGVFIVGGAATVTNAGTIDGGSGNAVLLPTGFQNRVIVDPGADFVGTVNGGTSVEATLELASSASRGTLSGIGTQFINFGTMAFDPSASWLVKASTSIAAATITGFGANDTIDLAGFVAVSDTFSANTLVLTNAGNAHVTLHVQGTFTTANFTIGGDGAGGTDLGFSTASAAALIYGQTIDEAGIAATSETVSAGTLTLFNGASSVGMVAVGTSLSSGDFILRPDGSGGTDVIVDTVFGTYANGVTLLTNPTTIAGAARISGTVAGAKGVYGPSGQIWTLANQGLVSESGASSFGISFASTGTIINTGRITGAQAGIGLTAGGAVTNQSSGTISGLFGVYAKNNPATVVNAGSVTGYYTANSAVGIYLQAGGFVTNLSTGTISGDRNGIRIAGARGTVVNLGFIHSNDVPGQSGQAGIYLADGGVVTNGGSGGTASPAYILGYQYAVQFGASAAGTLTNFGTLSGNPGNPAVMMATGTIINGPSGTTGALIEGGDQTNAVLISGVATVVNFARIIGVENPGDSAIYYGVRLGGSAGSISNLGAGGLIENYIGVYATMNDTVTNAGTIASNYVGGREALVFGGGTNRLILDPGASFIGAVSGSGPVTLSPTGNTQVIGTANGIGVTTLELASASSAGTLSGLGTTIVNFASLVFDSGAQWIVRGNDSAGGLGTLGITGFTFGDTIDLTGFVATSRAFAGNTLVLSNAGGAHETLAMQGTFSTANVRIASDGSGGTDVSLQLDLNYGDTVDEAGIVATSQTVAGGVMTLKNGVSTVGSIAVGGTLNTSEFTLRSDGAGGTDVIVSTVFGTYTSGVTLLTNPTTIGNTASISATSGDALYGVGGSPGWIINNYGVINGGTSAYGIQLGNGGNNAAPGSITNAAGASIEGRYGIRLYNSLTFSIVNQVGGTIAATGTNAGRAIDLEIGTGTVSNAGLITAQTTRPFDVGVELDGGGTVINAAGGTISGGWGVLVAGAGTVFNDGTISGVYSNEFAVALSNGDRLIADPGAVFIGAVNGGRTGGASTLELASAASAGTLATTNFTNFSTIDFDAGAAWTLIGTTTALSGAIVGFTFADTIDLLGFAAVSSTFASNTLVLNDGVGDFDTLAIQGTFVSGNFHLSSDGIGGTDIVFGAPPLLYGETIDEAGIVATSETVTAGVMTLLNGASPVGTIVAGTTLGTADFTLRPDGSGGTDVIVSTVFGSYTSSVTLVTNPTTIAATASIIGTVASGIGVIGPSGTAWTLVNQGLVSETGVSGEAISFASAGTITNTAGGVVTGSSVGIQLNAGGSVTNQSGGTISGVRGIYARTGLATVVNTGSISGNVTSGSGIFLDAGGIVTNQSGGTISGSYGVNADGSATVVNAGSIGDGASLPTGAAIALKNGGLIANQAGGQIIAGLQGIYFGGAAGTIVNSGSIGGGPTTGNGVIFATGGAVTNQSGGTITGKYGVRAVASAVIVVNAGSIGGNLTTGGGVNLAAGSAVTNRSGGMITGLRAVSVTGGTVTNAGGIVGNTTIGTGAGVQLVAGGAFTNQSGGMVTGFAGVYGKTGAATVVNAGGISGNSASGRGVLLAAGGSVTNQSVGVITGFDGILTTGGATVVNAGSIGGTTAVAFGSGATNRLVVDPGAMFSGTVDGGNTIGAASVSTLELASSASAGSLSGLGAQFIDFANVTVDIGANWTLSAANTLAAGVTLTNAGTLTATGSLQNDGAIIGNGSATGDYGIVIGAAGVLGNVGAVALIQGYGGVLVGTGGTVTNAGTIGSTQGVDGVALRFTGGNARLIDDPGAVFAGAINGGGTTVLELASASSAGAIAGFGSSVTNFSSLVFDSGARWTLAGDDATGGLGTLEISGFAIGDTIDLSGFAAVSETFASNTLVLSNGVGAHESLNIQGAFASDNFHIGNVGDGGTDITFLTPPTIVAGGTVSFAGGGSPVTLDGSVNVSDPNSTTLVGGTVSIGNLLIGDTLNFVDQDGITGSFDGATGALTLTGSATLADYQAALDSITYDFSPSFGDPTAGGDTTRTINWMVNDGTNPSTVATSTLDIVHVAPSITAGGTVSFTGGGGAVVLDSTQTLTDPDSGGLLNGGTVSIAGFVSGDILSADTTGHPNITTSYNAATGVLTLSGGDTLADYQAVLRSITYSVNPADGDPTGGGGDTGRTIDWLITDGASANGVSNIGISTLDTIHVGPTIAAGGTVSYIADGVAAVLDPTNTIADVDSAGTIAGATISIGAGFTSGDLLNFTDQNGISGTYDTVTGTLTLSGAATIANYEAALESVTYTFTPDGGDPTAGGTDARRIIVWTVSDGVDNSAATASTLDLTLPPPAIGGTVAGQTTTDEATINPLSGVSITDPNSGQSETISITVSRAGTPTDADGTLSGIGLSKTGTGTYTLAAGTPAAVTTALDALLFTPTAHQVVPGAAMTTGFTLAVIDTLSQSATDGTTSVVATAVNDPPVITGSVAGQITTDNAAVSPFSAVGISDVDFGQTESVTVTLSSAVNGTLSDLDGGSYDNVTGVYSVTGTDAAVTTAVDGLVFTPAAHQVAPRGSVTTTFTIVATDTAGDTTSSSTTTVAATAADDPPVINGTVAGQTTTDETTLSPFSGVGVSDADFGQTETVTVTLSNTANGALSNLDGGSYDSGTGVFSVTGTDAAVTSAVDGLVFTPTAHQVPPGGSVTTTFSIATTDTAGGTASDSTTTVTTTADNDPPAVTGTVAGQRMSNNATIRPFSGVTISDPDVGASETVTITLTYGGTPTGVYGTLSGADLTETGNGIYTLATGSPDAVTAALDALIFTPIPDSVVPDRTITTGMMLSVTDGMVGSPTTDTTTSVNAIACFAAGTRIATPRGAVAVERLREGDRVLTVSGKPRPVQWIGRRTLDCNRHIAPQRVKPVRIAPHAFGEDRPRRALLLSPDHSVFIEDVMIPIKHLINGTTITQIDVSTVTYYHIELERHDVVLAEGLPAETYLETGGRGAFENGGGAIDLHPDFAPDENRVGMVWRNFAYAPLVGGEGQLDRVRTRLALQAAMLTQQAAAAPARTKKLRRRA